MQDHEDKNDLISSSQLMSGMDQQAVDKQKSVRINVDENQMRIISPQNKDDNNQQIGIGMNNSSSLLSDDISQLSNQNNSANITGKKRSKISLQHNDESTFKSPSRKRQRNSNRNDNTSDMGSAQVNSDHLSHEQLQQIQTEEQIAFQSQMIEEGIIPQPHIMQAIQQRQLISQSSNNRHNSNRKSKRHKNDNNRNNTHSAANNNISNRSSNRASLFTQGNGGANDNSSNDDHDKNNDNGNNYNNWHNDSDSNSSDSQDEVREHLTDSKALNQLQNLKNQNDRLQKQLEESNKQFDKLMDSMQSDGMSNNDNKSNSNNELVIYNNVIKQQQLQIKQLMR